jgi:hypothetical protein
MEITNASPSTGDPIPSALVIAADCGGGIPRT